MRGGGDVLRVGTAAWSAARDAWRDRAAASARALIASRTSAAKSPSTISTRFEHLATGSHPTPTRTTRRTRDGRDVSSVDALPPWPPGASPRPGRSRRHVIDGAFDARDVARLERVAATALDPLRDRARGDACVTVGRASESLLGEDAHVVMTRVLREMRVAAEDALRGDEGGKEDVALHPVGGLLTHIRAATTGGDGDDAATAAGGGREEHGYWSPHVDKANVPEYDISAVLYLSSGAGGGSDDDADAEDADFEGGEVRSYIHPTGPHTTALARCTAFLEDFLSRRSFLSAQGPSLSIPTHLDAFQLRF